MPDQHDPNINPDISTGREHGIVPPQPTAPPRPRRWRTVIRAAGRALGYTGNPAGPPEDQHARPTRDTRRWSRHDQAVLRRYHATNLAAARRATEQLVREGWHTGRVPYGYRPQRTRISPHGHRPRYRTRLLIEPVEASVVKMIFLWRVQDGLTIDQIVRHLTNARYPAPLRPDTGQPSSWTPSLIRAILRNPKYLGRQVWGRRHHGHRTPQAHWVWSDTWAHPPVIDPDTFTAAQRPTNRPPARGGRPGPSTGSSARAAG